MKPIPFKVTDQQHISFHVQVNEGDHQYDNLHFHPEYQISLIMKGQGIASIGNSIDRFETDDIYLIGPNIPHVFKHDERQEKPSTDKQPQIVSLFFMDTSFGRGFFDLPEMVVINDLLTESKKGIKLCQDLVGSVKPLIQDLINKSGAMRIIQLITILHYLAIHPEKKYLSKVVYRFSGIPAFTNRLNRIFHYISENFDQPISLDEAARVANLSRFAFCRYFKKSTHKSFIHYLNEFRIGMACKFLSISTYNITQISFLAGFNNLSHFNRQFKRIMKCTPTEYRDLRKALG